MKKTVKKNGSETRQLAAHKLLVDARAREMYPDAETTQKTEKKHLKK